MINDIKKLEDFFRKNGDLKNLESLNSLKSLAFLDRKSENITNLVKLNPGVDIENLNPITKSFIIELGRMAQAMNLEKPQINSGYRDPESQAKLMISNWKRNGGVPKSNSRGPAVVPNIGAANSYLSGLYGANGSKINGIISKHKIGTRQETKSSLDECIKEVTSFILSNKISSHTTGYAIDLNHKTKGIMQILDAMKSKFDFSLLDETNTAGPHYHITVRSGGSGSSEDYDFKATTQAPGPITMPGDRHYTYEYDASKDVFRVVTDTKRDKYQRVGFEMGPTSIGYQRLIQRGMGQGIEKAKETYQSKGGAVEQETRKGFFEKIMPGASKNKSNAGAQLMQRTNASQNEAISIIQSEFLNAGYPMSIAQAAVVNAKAESNLNPSAVGDGGKSIGLFQLHESGGGKGMSREQRMDPVLNTKRIIQEMRAVWNKSSDSIESLSDAVARGASVGELAGLFSYHVERPADRVGSISVRQRLARKLFGPEADKPTTN